MCTSTPDVPTMPERQAIKLPDDGSDAQGLDARRRRRIAYAASIRAGMLSPPSTTGGAGGATTLG